MVKNSQKAYQDIVNLFPKLRTDRFFKPTSEKTNKYNCIAWAMRLTDRWVDIVKTAGHWWPNYEEGRQYTQSKEELIEAFEMMKFTKCNNILKETLYDKVALYYNPKTGCWTHAARVINEKEFHSKLGALWDIHHSSNGNILYNSNPHVTWNGYGVIFQYMKRPKYLRVYSHLLMLKAFSDDIKNLFVY